MSPLNIDLAGMARFDCMADFFLFIKRMQDAHFCKHHDASGARIFTTLASVRKLQSITPVLDLVSVAVKRPNAK